MREVVTVEKINNVHIKVTCDPGIRQELSQYFAFRPPNYQFTPSYKNRVWDGYIRLYTPMKPFLYIGLLDHLIKFCEEREYDIVLPKSLTEVSEVTWDEMTEFAGSLNLPFEVRDYQMQYILNAVNKSRSISLSPTSSGKSLIIYILQQYYNQIHEARTLIVVPTVSLVYQMTSDFESYGCDVKSTIHQIMSGAEKTSNKPVVISTWQSLANQPKEWFDQFQVILGDEAHLFQAKSLTSIMERMTEAEFRHGFTGTISSDSKVHKLILQGLFGPIVQYITTSELIEQQSAADFKIKAIVLNHSDEVKKTFNAGMNAIRKKNKNSAKKVNLFNAEKEFVNNLERRNIFLRNLVWSLKDQNNLILFERVEKHGKILEPLLHKEGRILHFIDGNMKGKDRDKIRTVIENDNIHQVKLSFGNVIITIKADEIVPLTNGQLLAASEITTDHNIANSWIESKVKEQYPL